VGTGSMVLSSYMETAVVLEVEGYERTSLEDTMCRYVEVKLGGSNLSWHHEYWHPLVCVASRGASQSVFSRGDGERLVV
jgi:hypothetical protein